MFQCKAQGQWNFALEALSVLSLVEKFIVGSGREMQLASIGQRFAGLDTNELGMKIIEAFQRDKWLHSFSNMDNTRGRVANSIHDGNHIESEILSRESFQSGHQTPLL